MPHFTGEKIKAKKATVGVPISAQQVNEPD